MWLNLTRMTLRISVALAGIFLAAFGLFATAPQAQLPQSPVKTANPVEAARMNNLGAAYMNSSFSRRDSRHSSKRLSLIPN
jgi:hypothetical protein